MFSASTAMRLPCSFMSPPLLCASATSWLRRSHGRSARTARRRRVALLLLLLLLPLLDALLDRLDPALDPSDFQAQPDEAGELLVALRLLLHERRELLPEGDQPRPLGLEEDLRHALSLRGADERQDKKQRPHSHHDPPSARRPCRDSRLSYGAEPIIGHPRPPRKDRKSTRLNSSHVAIS